MYRYIYIYSEVTLGINSPAETCRKGLSVISCDFLEIKKDYVKDYVNPF